jgi:hypothetical protein
MHHHMSFFMTPSAPSFQATGRGGHEPSHLPPFADFPLLAGPPDLPNPTTTGYDAHHDPMDMGAAAEPDYHHPPGPIPIPIPIPTGPAMDTRALTEGSFLPLFPPASLKRCGQRRRSEGNSPTHLGSSLKARRRFGSQSHLRPVKDLYTRAVVVSQALGMAQPETTLAQVHAKEVSGTGHTLQDIKALRRLFSLATARTKLVSFILPHLGRRARLAILQMCGPGAPLPPDFSLVCAQLEAQRAKMLGSGGGGGSDYYIDDSVAGLHTPSISLQRLDFFLNHIETLAREPSPTGQNLPSQNALHILNRLFAPCPSCKAPLEQSDDPLCKMCSFIC